MSWKDRATKVEGTSGWKTRASAVEEPKKMSDNLLDTIENLTSSIGEGINEYGIKPLAAAGQGITDVMTGGWGDEISGGAQALADVISGDRDISELPEAQAERAKQFREMAKATEEQSPIAHTLGQGIGTAATMLGTGGMAAGAQGVAKTSKLLDLLKNTGIGAGTGAVMGAGESEGSIAQNPEQVAKDAISGGMAGGVIGGAGQSILQGAGKLGSYIGNKAKNFADDHSIFRQAFIRPYQEGVKGTPFTSDKWIEQKGINLSGDAAKEMFSKIKEARDLLGKEVSGTLQKATDAGKVIDLTPVVTENAPQLLKYLKDNPLLIDNKKIADVVDRIVEGQTELNPMQVKELRDVLYSVSEKLSSGTGSEKAIGSFASKYAGKLKDLLGSEIPEFATANSRYKNFMEKVPETILSGNIPRTPGSKKAMDLSNYDDNLMESLMTMYEGATHPGKAGDFGKGSYVNLINNIKELEKTEAERVAKGIKAPDFLSKLGKSDQLENEIKDKSDLINVLGRSRAVDPHAGTKTTGKSIIETGGAGTSGASILVSHGKHVGQVAGYLSKELYHKPTNELLDIANNMKGTKFQHLGESLERAVNNKSEALKNATIFSMLQNPEVRNMFNSEGNTPEE